LSARVAVGSARKLVTIVYLAVWIATNVAAIAGSAVTSARVAVVSAKVTVGSARKLITIVCLAVWIATNVAAIAEFSVTGYRIYNLPVVRAHYV